MSLIKYDSKDEEHLATIERILSNTTKDIINKKNKPLSNEQLKTLKKFYEFYSNKPSKRGGKMSITTVKNCLVVLKQLGHSIQKPYEKVKTNDIIDYVKTIKSVSSSSSTKININYFYREFLKLKKVVDSPLLVPELVKGKKTKKDLPTKDDIILLINACYNTKDKCIIMLLAEGGLRAEEIVSLNNDSIEFDDMGSKIWIEESKTKRRYERVIESSPYLEQWLKENPLKEKKDPLFPSFQKTKEMGYKRMRSKGIWWTIDRIKKRVPELKDKKLHPHLFRHYAITQRWKEGMRTETNASRHGITPSTLRDVYLHYDDKDADQEYLEIHGKEPSKEELYKKEQERKRLLPKKCEYCDTLNEFNRNYCKNCHKPIDVTTFVEQEKKQEQLNKFLSMFMETKEGHKEFTPEDIVKTMIKMIKVNNS